MADPTLTSLQATADADDSGWEITSASSPLAVVTPPDDTTQEPGKPQYRRPEPAAPTDEDEAAEAEPSAATPISPLATKEPDKEPAEPKGAGPRKKGPTVDERRKSITREIDTLTYQKHQTQREIDDARQQLASLRAQLAQPTGITAPDAKIAKPDVPASQPFPPHPRYQDFDTDAEYQKAEAKWNDDVAAWQSERERAIETRLTSGVEARLDRERQEHAAAEADQAFVNRLDTARAAHPDWEEKRVALADLRSSWHDPARHGPVTTPFLYDLAQSIDEGAELLYWVASNPDYAQAAADLLPTRPLRDALVAASSPLRLLQHFATPEGQVEFEQLKGMHPVRLFQAVGALTARLTAPRGPVGVPHPITQAVPSAKPPVGTPRARDSAGPTKPKSFEDWMREEDARERREREHLAGIVAR